MRRPIWCAAYLAALEATDGKRTASADFAEVDRKTVDYRERVDPSFKRDIDQIYELLALRRLERLAKVLPAARQTIAAQAITPR